MDKVSAELADLKSALGQATKKMAILDELVASAEPKSDLSLISVDKEPDKSLLIDRAESLLKWGRSKAKVMDWGAGLFSDSCWNMCLDIYICDLKGERITVSSIAHSSGIPMTTAMRYINVMVEQGLLAKSPNPSDQRMVFVSTSEAGRDKISQVLQSMG